MQKKNPVLIGLAACVIGLLPCLILQLAPTGSSGLSTTLALVVAAIVLALIVSAVIARQAAKAWQKQHDKYRTRVAHVMISLQNQLQIAADELRREQKFDAGAQAKLMPVIETVDNIVRLIMRHPGVVNKDRPPEVLTLLQSIKQHTEEELVRPFGQPVTITEPDVIRHKVMRASWSVACVSLLTTQLIGDVVPHR